jgi:hypothetical protein
MEEEEAIFKRNILAKKDQKVVENESSQVEEVERIKSPYSDTMSTAASHRKPK